MLLKYLYPIVAEIFYSCALLIIGKLRIFFKIQPILSKRSKKTPNSNIKSRYSAQSGMIYYSAKTKQNKPTNKHFDLAEKQ